MNLKKSGLALSLAIITGAVALAAQAANLNSGDVLTINAGVQAYDANGNYLNVSSGSWFAMDTNGNSVISGAEKSALSQGIQGIVIGIAQPAGVSHSGYPTGTEANAIDAAWPFFGNTGMHFTTSAISGGTGGLNMLGWAVTWNGIPFITLGSLAWGAGYTSGIGNLVWNGSCDAPYTLDYRAAVPYGDPSGFGGVKYALHLEGTVQCIVDTPPTVPSTSPASGAANVGISGSGSLNYLVTFSEAMAPASVTSAALSVSGGVTVGTPTTSDNKSFSFPLSGLAYGTSYTVTFNPGPTDANGTPLILPASKTFSTSATVDATAPTLSGRSPAPGGVSVATTAKVVLGFSEVMDPATVSGAFSLTPILPAGAAVAGTISTMDNVTFTFTPSSLLSNNTVYSASLAATATDTAGNIVAAQTWNFTVGAQTQPFLGNPGAVTGNHSCGVKNDGSVVCWGAGSGASYTPGTFTQVSSGANHNCGLKFDGSITCWGSNTSGQSTAPLP